MTYDLGLGPDGDLLLGAGVGEGDDDGSQGMPDDIQQDLALLAVQDLHQCACRPLPDEDCVLFHRACAHILPVARETALAPVTSAIDDRLR